MHYAARGLVLGSRVGIDFDGPIAAVRDADPGLFQFHASSLVNMRVWDASRRPPTALAA